MLQFIYTYSIFWRFKFNMDKCAVIIFQGNKIRQPIVHGQCKNVCTCHHHFQFGPFLINEVLSYKYLGLDLDYRLIFRDFKTRISAKASSNLGRIWYMGIKDGLLSIKGGINVYKSLVLSGLEFNSEVWGFDLWSNGEDIQYQFARSILRASSKTSKPALIGELGLMSLYGRRCYKKLISWWNIISMADNRLVKHVYEQSKLQSNKKNNWYKQMGKFSTTMG